MLQQSTLSCACCSESFIWFARVILSRCLDLRELWIPEDLRSRFIQSPHVEKRSESAVGDEQKVGYRYAVQYTSHSSRGVTIG